MFGTSHCCNSSSSCTSETRERTPASAGAERQPLRIECAVRILRSASDVARAVAALEDTPTTASWKLHLRGNATGLFKRAQLAADKATTTRTESTRFRRALDYTTTGFGAFGNVPGKTNALCGQCERKTQETSDVQPTRKKQLFDGEHRVQR